MSFHPSSLHVAGQDSDLLDVLFPSSEARYLLDVGLSPVPDKQMYGTNESIKSWINATDRANVSILKLDDSSDANVFRFPKHPFRTCRSHSSLSDEFDSESEISFCLDASDWAPRVLAPSYYDDSDETRSDSSLEDDAQYITIPSDSPWYCLPPSSPGPVSAHELVTLAYTKSCSSDVRQAIAQQQLLLSVFYDELRRVIPHDDGTEYVPDWLEGVDADLVLAPLETYADLCWESAVCEKSPPWLNKPLPDVPTGFDEGNEIY